MWSRNPLGGCPVLFPLVSPCGPQLAHGQVPQSVCVGFSISTPAAAGTGGCFSKVRCGDVVSPGKLNRFKALISVMTQSKDRFSVPWTVSLVNTKANVLLKDLSRRDTLSPSPVCERHHVQRCFMNLSGLRISAYTKFGNKGKRKLKLRMPQDSPGVSSSPFRSRVWAGDSVHQVKALAVQTL